MSDFLLKIREESELFLAKTPLPTTKDEDWKYTNLKQVFKHSFSTANKSPSLKSLDGFDYPKLNAYLVVIENGKINSSLSEIPSHSTGFSLSYLGLEDFESKVEQFSSMIGSLSNAEDYFYAYNTTQFTQFFLLTISGKIDKPIHFLHIQNEEFTQAVSRTLVHVSEDSSCEIMNTYIDQSGNNFFQNVEELFLEKRSKLKHTVFQNTTYTIASVNVNQASESEFISNVFTLDGKLVRNDINIYSNGENTNTKIFGAFKGFKKSHIDNHTSIIHNASNCESEEVFKGILENASVAVFNGKVRILKNAQKINAFQQNDTILIDEDSTVNSKPQLEIFADDVKCSHGCTVGDFDADMLFYLKTRGISYLKSIEMLKKAFYQETLKGIDNEELKQFLENHLVSK